MSNPKQTPAPSPPPIQTSTIPSTQTHQHSLCRTGKSTLLVPPSVIRRVYSEKSVGRCISTLSIDQIPIPECQHFNSALLQMEFVPKDEQHFVTEEKRKHDRAKIVARMFDRLRVLVQGKKDTEFKPVTSVSRGVMVTRGKRISFEGF